MDVFRDSRSGISHSPLRPGSADASFALRPEPRQPEPGLPADRGLSPVTDEGNGLIDAGDIARATPMARRDLGAALAARPERVIVIGDYHTSSGRPQALDAAIAAALAAGQTVTAGLEIPAHPAWSSLVDERNAGRLSPGAFGARFLEAARSVYGPGDPRPELFAGRVERAFAAGARVALLDPPPGAAGPSDGVMEARAIEAWRRHGTDRLFLEVGNLHAQGRPGVPGDLTSLGVDLRQPLGKRLEERLGAAAVLTVATVPGNALGPAAFRPPHGTWDAVVRLLPEAEEPAAP